MAETVIFEAQELSEFVYVENLGLYGMFVSPAPFVPVVGQTYRVVWDDVSYECVAQDAGSVVDGATFIGDATAFGLLGNGEPFIIGGQTTSPMNVYALKDTEATPHTVSIYQIVEDKGIVVKDRTGADVEHIGAVGVRVRTLDGGTKELVDSDTIPDPVEKEIQLDFSEGDMVVTPDAGTVYEKVSIPKPETLIPENIAKDVNICGVIGTCEAVGAEKRIEYTYNDAGEIVGATPYGFTVLPDGAFAYISTLEWVDFSNCPDLVDLGRYTFFNCTGLTGFAIPEGVTNIGDRAFYNCAGLTSISIPNTVKTIGTYALGLTNITSVVIPDSVTSVGSYLFYYCKKLESVTLGSGFWYLASNIFMNCTGLTGITIPDTITQIGSMAFYGCTGLTKITIPKNVNFISTQAFYLCSNLTSVTFEDTSGWYTTTSAGATSGTSMTLTYPSSNANYLVNTYTTRYWYDKT